MKKAIALLGGLFFLSQGALAQRGQELTGFSKSSFEDALSHSSITALLSSPEFQLVLTMVVLLAAGSWLFYFWIAFYLGRDGEWSFREMIKDLFSARNATATHRRLATPDSVEPFSSIPRLDVHRSGAPLLAAEHEAPEAPERGEEDSVHGRGG